jgi:hypothetical protein
MNTKLALARCSLLAAALAGASGCGAPPRFALRPPVVKDSDDRPFPRALPEDSESDFANSLDVILLRPISHAFLFEQGGEARNVNSLDEVPDSTWYTNRVVAPEDLERGPCPAEDATPPFKIRSSKTSGATPGFAVKDARGQKYMIKRDALLEGQQEVGTAADAIVSRLYWAIGFNAPCNNVLYIDEKDMVIDEKSMETRAIGKKRPLKPEKVADALKTATRRADGKLRVSASRFIDGEPVGTWRTEGTRSDDPNDVIPHEDRRELRGERFLAAWVNHWDSRGPQSFDTFVRSPDKKGGYVLHYFIDFSDSLGATPMRTRWPEPRMGFTTVSNAPTIAADVLTFGLIRRPWDEVRVDPRFPNLGFFNVEHFEPMHYSPQTPLVRWARAQSSDLGWMARKIARFTTAHVKVAVKQGKWSNPAEEARLVELLMGRREKILRAAFSKSSPLADLAMKGPGRLCATDLGVTTGMSKAESVSYLLELREGEELERSRGTPVARRTPETGQLCIDLPHFAPAGLPDDSAARYATLDVVRNDGRARTTLRAHFYDLGPKRGYVLVGVERP